MIVINSTLIHLKQLLLLEQSVFSKEEFQLSYNNFRYHLLNNHVFHVEIDNKVVAYILYLNREKSLRIYSLCVDVNYRKIGLSKILIQYLIEFAKKNGKEKITLEVNENNLKAINLYDSFNFKRKKLLKNYYGINNGVLMEKILCD